MLASQRHVIGLRHTDAAGHIFFPRLLEIAQDTLEFAMRERGVSVAERIRGDGPILPIVHCEADFRRPLRVDDVVTVEMRCERVGGSSLTFAYRFVTDDGTEAATARIVHAAMDRATGASVPLTEEMRRLASDDADA